MTRIANKEERERGYRSALREQQAAETRACILDAAVRVMARGLASLSIPAVAREAGVSIPTVYRHFGTKADLLKAIYPHLVRRVGLYEMAQPRSVGEFRDAIHRIFERLDASGDLARAAMASPAGEEARRATMPDRLRVSRQLLDTIAPELPEADRERIARVMVVLTTSSALRMWRDHLGASVDDAADEVEWTLRALIESSAGRAK